MRPRHGIVHAGVVCIEERGLWVVLQIVPRQLEEQIDGLPIIDEGVVSTEGRSLVKLLDEFVGRECILRQAFALIAECAEEMQSIGGQGTAVECDDGLLDILTLLSLGGHVCSPFVG